MKNLSKNNLPLVSIIIPCRNEERFIGKCLDSILEQDYPRERLEILVVDGMSEDGTKRIVQEFMKKYSIIKIFNNPQKFTPFGMNIGVTNSRGDMVVMVSAHSILDKEFVRFGVNYLARIKEADAVGGKLQTIDEGQGIISQAIPLAADSMFGAGGKRYRTRQEEGFIQDTAPYCVYRKEVFQKIGYIDEELIRDQDEEFNYRLIKEGGKLYFTPKIKSYLYIRPSISKLWRQHFQYGYWKVKVLEKVGVKFVQRQIVPSLFISSLILSGILGIFYKPFFYLFLLITCSYLALDIIFSLSLSLKNSFKYFFILPIIFGIIHFSYGFGFLKGIVDFMIFKRKIKNVPLTR